VAGSHEEAVLLGAAKTKVRTNFRQMNFSDALAVGRKDVHAIKAVRSDDLAQAKEILS